MRSSAAPSSIGFLRVPPHEVEAYRLRVDDHQRADVQGRLDGAAELQHKKKTRERCGERVRDP